MTFIIVYLLPRDAAKTAPKPMAKGPPMFKNLSLGAQTATADRPPTIPAVYLFLKQAIMMLKTQ